MMETVRQLTIIEARRDKVAREATLKAEIEKMKKIQYEIEEQMRQFLSLQSNLGSLGGNGGVGGQEAVNEGDEKKKTSYLSMIDFFIVIYVLWCEYRVTII